MALKTRDRDTAYDAAWRRARMGMLNLELVANAQAPLFSIRLYPSPYQINVDRTQERLPCSFGSPHYYESSEYQLQIVQEVSIVLSNLGGSPASLFLAQLACVQMTTSFNVTAGYTLFLGLSNWFSA